jgi:hypothetical protein
MSFIEKLQNANTVESYLADLHQKVDLLMTGKVLFEIARAGKSSHIMTEPGYFKYQNQLVAARIMSESTPGYEGFSYKLISVQPRFKLQNGPDVIYLNHDRSCSVACTEADCYQALEMSWTSLKSPIKTIN